MTQSSKFSFASGANATYVDSLYEDFKSNPESVESSWQQFFAGYEFAASAGAGEASSESGSDDGKIEAFINAYRRIGHLGAHLNPLADKPGIHPELSPERHDLGSIDKVKNFSPTNLKGIEPQANFEKIFSHLKKTYCGNIGADFRDIESIDAVLWLQDQMESCKNNPEFSSEEKLFTLKKLIETEGFEKFLQDRFLGQKRFSIEGVDSMIPLMSTIANEAALNGVDEIHLGMAHRGRLNVLANFMGKPYEDLLTEFEGGEVSQAIEGDVKYHKGYCNRISTQSGKEILLHLSPNPSHLEVVNPVVEGFCRARQRFIAKGETKPMLPILIHGDAAFMGQGLVAETLNLAELKDYTTGGTIHIIANNQIGFTADPEEARSCRYASDISKIIRAPILHVNADDPNAVMWAAKLATWYRQKFKKDFVIDLIGYRRHGHNETDEPGFTQPLMYKTIKKHPTTLGIYSQRLIGEKVISEEDFKAQAKQFRAQLQKGLDQVRAGQYQSLHEIPEEFKYSLKYTFANREMIDTPSNTAISAEVLKDIVTKFTSFPQGFTPHPKIKKLFDTRAKMINGDGALDWGMAELLAFGSCAIEGHHVRLSGQDCRRGTFSHRHGVLRDFETNEPLEILNFLSPDQQPVDIINSPLSEQGCLGFEFGYSVADSNALVIWEAQFGDFANGAQIIVDQFLAASEAKWKQTSSMVMLLPHGYEGQGPEHSSARPERFLQSCGNLNIQVANCTTPAQIFHILRRQMKRDFQKPLVIMTPKSLLRHSEAVSKISDFTDARFQEIIPSSAKEPEKVEKVLACSGKIYYELKAAQAEGTDLPIYRFEQLYPFPKAQIARELEKYSNCKEIIWVQEEPANMGAWSFIRPKLESTFKDSQIKITYVGRRHSGSTAEGSNKSHKIEQERIIHDALGISCRLQDLPE